MYVQFLFNVAALGNNSANPFFLPPRPLTALLQPLASSCMGAVTKSNFQTSFILTTSLLWAGCDGCTMDDISGCDGWTTDDTTSSPWAGCGEWTLDDSGRLRGRYGPEGLDAPHGQWMTRRSDTEDYELAMGWMRRMDNGWRILTATSSLWAGCDGWTTDKIMAYGVQDGYGRVYGGRRTPMEVSTVGVGMLRA
ncbi:hypothetical protein B0H34DRAFT_675557 [Crassisporium funariophilum]|nr:hypothetical protein B0H34DRAFT_675557 [Crassisporium funariophilum]